ncbi:MAG: hypothetical protein KGR23_13595, partial [Betaproteobacteria bacterium]|nr:hypothetical protein [Betaproteobacteria bacterium]
MAVSLTISGQGSPAAACASAAIDEEAASPMTDAQRAALAALVRPQAATRPSRWKRRDATGDVAWAGVLALMLGLSLHVLVEGLRFVREADTLQAIIAARARVDAQMAQSPSTAPAAPGVVDAAAVVREPADSLAEGRQSSGV